MLLSSQSSKICPQLARYHSSESDFLEKGGFTPCASGLSMGSLVALKHISSMSTGGCTSSITGAESPISSPVRSPLSNLSIGLMCSLSVRALSVAPDKGAHANIFHLPGPLGHPLGPKKTRIFNKSSGFGTILVHGCVQGSFWLPLGSFWQPLG